MSKKQISIFIAGGIAIYLIATLVFKFSGREYYKAIFKEAPGLKTGTKVVMLGVKIGIVDKITVYKDSVAARFWIKDVKLRGGTVYSLEPSNLFGDKHLVILNGGGNSLPSHSSIYGTTKKGLGEAIVYLGNFLEHLDSLTVNLTTETQKSFDATTKGLDKILSNVEEEAVATLKSVREVSNNTNNMITQSTENLDTTIANLKDISSVLKNLLTSVDTSLIVTLYSLSRTTAQLDTLTSSLLSGKGTAGKLMASDSLYNEINATVKSLKLLLEDIKKDPKRYLNIF